MRLSDALVKKYKKSKQDKIAELEDQYPKFKRMINKLLEEKAEEGSAFLYDTDITSGNTDIEMYFLDKLIRNDDDYSSIYKGYCNRYFKFYWTDL